MRFLDLFAGIGGFRLGMEMAGHTPVGYVEWDKFARKSYEAMHDTEGEWTAHDITTVTDDDIRQFRDRGQIDVICGGFPCQAFSVAGRKKGFEDTRGTLFFDIMRFADIIRPRYLFLENVKGLLNHDNGNTFETIIRTLDELGYDAEWELLNSKHYGVAHNRERVFIIGHLRGQSTRKVFPIKKHTTGTLKGFQGDVSGKGYASQQDRVAFSDGIIPCVPASQTKSKVKVMIGDEIRYMTPKEVWRVQGFPDELFYKAAEVNSDSQLYKQAGNSVTVNVIYEIAKRLGD